MVCEIGSLWPGVWGLLPEGRSGIRNSRFENRNSGIGGQRTEDRGRRAEDRGQKSEVRGRNKVFNHKGKLSFRRFLINEYIDKVFIAAGFNRRI